MRAGRLIRVAIFLIFGSVVSLPVLGKTPGHQVDGPHAARQVGPSSVPVDFPEVLARTERYFRGKRVRGDVGFLLQQGAKIRGKRLALEPAPALLEKKDVYPYSIEYRLWEMRDAAMPRIVVSVPKQKGADFDPAQSRLLDDESYYEKRAFYQNTYVMRLMSNAMYCKPGDKFDEAIGPPGYEYISSHQIFATLVLVRRGCLSDGNIASKLAVYAGRVRDELHHNLQLTLSDLQLERGVMLCLVSRCDLVPKEFLLAVASAQDKSGLWYTKELLAMKGRIPPEHPTALAYYLLSMASPR